MRPRPPHLAAAATTRIKRPISEKNKSLVYSDVIKNMGKRKIFILSWMCTVYIYLYGWLSTDSKTKKKGKPLGGFRGAYFTRRAKETVGGNCLFHFLFFYL